MSGTSGALVLINLLIIMVGFAGELLKMIIISACRREGFRGAEYYMEEQVPFHTIVCSKALHLEWGKILLVISGKFVNLFISSRHIEVYVGVRHGQVCQCVTDRCANSLLYAKLNTIRHCFNKDDKEVTI